MLIIFATFAATVPKRVSDDIDHVSVDPKAFRHPKKKKNNQKKKKGPGAWERPSARADGH